MRLLLPESISITLQCWYGNFTICWVSSGSNTTAVSAPVIIIYKHRHIRKFLWSLMQKNNKHVYIYKISTHFRIHLCRSNGKNPGKYGCFLFVFRGCCCWQYTDGLFGPCKCNGCSGSSSSSSSGWFGGGLVVVVVGVVIVVEVSAVVVATAAQSSALTRTVVTRSVWTGEDDLW